MPRLTNQQYLANSCWLRGIWFCNLKTLYAVLPVQHQIDLHAYFAPTKELTDEERIDHRKIISRDFPDLPARAGRYYSRMQDLYDEAIQFANGDMHLIGSGAGFVDTVSTTPAPDPVIAQRAQPGLDENQDKAANATETG